jgi:hypothetical protein
LPVGGGGGGVEETNRVGWSDGWLWRRAGWSQRSGIWGVRKRKTDGAHGSARAASSARRPEGHRSSALASQRHDVPSLQPSEARARSPAKVVTREY